MDESVLLGIRHHTVPIPRWIWQRQVRGKAQLDFMTEEHRRIRNLAVTELPRAGKPLSPEFIAQELKLPLDQVVDMLDDLEKHMTFLFRNEQGAVEWAYPVTVGHTPHRMTFSTGEQVNAAWAIDAIAVPFVQGRLTEESLSFIIETECGHCRDPIQIEIDSELKYRVMQMGAEPLVYVPMVDVQTLEEPSIIDGFWRKSIFFWSEEHAKEHRRKVGGERGLYMTLPQSVYVTRIVQGALFGFGQRDWFYPITAPDQPIVRRRKPL